MTEQVKRTVNSKGDIIITMDNKKYLKAAPDGFKEATEYLTTSNEYNKAVASDIAAKELKENKDAGLVKIRIPFGSGKLDNLELNFQRERTFVDVAASKKEGKKVTNTNPYMGQKAKSRLMGTNTNMSEVKERFKKAMSKA